MNDLFDSNARENLQYAQKLRLGIIQNVLGGALPDETNLEKAQFLMSALRDVERVELDTAKIRVQQSNQDSANANAAIMMQLMRNLSSPTAIPQYVDTVLPDELEADLIEGEADLQYRQISFDELSADAEE